MELTLENLISFIKEEIYEKEVLPINTIREDFGLDGIAAIDLLLNLEKEFSVSFEDFDLKKYFLGEEELFNSLSLKTLFKRSREIKQELTIEELYDYMLEHKK